MVNTYTVCVREAEMNKKFLQSSVGNTGVIICPVSTSEFFLFNSLLIKMSLFMNFTNCCKLQPFKSKHVREKKKNPFRLLESFTPLLAHIHRTSHEANGVFPTMNPLHSSRNCCSLNTHHFTMFLHRDLQIQQVS